VAAVCSAPLLLILLAALPARAKKPRPWPEGVQEIKYPSAADDSMQPAMYYAPESEEPVPLLVGLHTWSGDYTQRSGITYAGWCVRRKWAFIFPDFRGPNRRPEATGSELVVQDILSAVEYVKKQVNVDENRIYLVGASGGGYTALLMAGRAPDVWAGVSAWVPISDLKAWYHEKEGKGYGAQVAASCGGAPGSSDAVDEEYRKRSPLTWLANARGVNLDINAGIHDGHNGSVPISHSLNAFNAVAKPEDRIPEEDIRYFVEKESVPPHLKQDIEDPAYGSHKPLFRRSSGKVRVTIFEGGHQIVTGAALQWLAGQKKD
jgi:poly(3-hydroxybutyrate) depolymerase